MPGGTPIVVRVTGRLNPFIGFQSRARPTEIRQLFGGSGLKGGGLARQTRVRAETLWRGTVGTGLSMIFMNRALSGKWPWENASGHAEDLNTGIKDKNGATLYLPLALLDPGMARAGRSVALWDALDKRAGWDPSDRWGRMALWRMASEVRSFVMGGPALQTAEILTTGRTNYTTPTGERLRIAEPAYSGTQQWINNAQAAVATLNPNVEIFLHDWVVTHNDIEDPRLKWFMNGGRMILGKWGEIGPSPLKEAGEIGAAETRRVNEITVYYAQAYNNTTDAEKRTRILDEAVSSMPKSIRPYARLQLIRTIRSMQKSAAKRPMQTEMWRSLHEEEAGGE